MLTVKHITLSGAETLYQAYEVSFQPTDAESQVKRRSPIESRHVGGTLHLTKPTMSPGELGTYDFGIQGGTVFVMNDKGATVSRYDLGASEVPHGADALTLHHPSTDRAGGLTAIASEA